MVEPSRVSCPPLKVGRRARCRAGFDKETREGSSPGPGARGRILVGGRGAVLDPVGRTGRALPRRLASTRPRSRIPAQRRDSRGRRNGVSGVHPLRVSRGQPHRGARRNRGHSPPTATSPTRRPHHDRHPDFTEPSWSTAQPLRGSIRIRAVSAPSVRVGVTTELRAADRELAPLLFQKPRRTQLWTARRRTLARPHHSARFLRGTSRY